LKGTIFIFTKIAINHTNFDLEMCLNVLEKPGKSLEFVINRMVETLTV
jgi:hypothetical protein